jgi:hypothetical protein
MYNFDFDGLKRYQPGPKDKNNERIINAQNNLRDEQNVSIHYWLITLQNLDLFNVTQST